MRPGEAEPLRRPHREGAGSHPMPSELPSTPGHTDLNQASVSLLAHGRHWRPWLCLNGSLVSERHFSSHGNRAWEAGGGEHSGRTQVSNLIVPRGWQSLKGKRRRKERGAWSEGPASCLAATPSRNQSSWPPG